MPLASITDVLKQAEKKRYGVGAFNVSDLNQAMVVIEAAIDEQSPVIVQVNAGFHPFEDEARWWRSLRALCDDAPVPVVLHLDHGLRYSDCERAVKAGFSSVMIDASRDPETGEAAEYEANVALTASVVELAHAHGVAVEGELGTVGGAEAGRTGTDEALLYTDPEQAREFVERTGVDCLAIAVGTTHGAVKYSADQLADKIKTELIAEIRERVPGVHIVMHGSSSVPAEDVAMINAHGGTLSPSVGIAPQEKIDAIARGLSKINQGTDSHLAFTSRLREFMTREPAEVEPSVIVGDALAGMRAQVALRMREWGSSGQAPVN